LCRNAASGALHLADAAIADDVTVLVHDEEEGGYWAEVPEFPGSLSQADTLDDLEHNIREAIEAWLMANVRTAAL
jgi:predicted RNase H-like HicB family nuclease